MVAASVGVCYPVTPAADYAAGAPGVSALYGRPLKTGYDCHCAAVQEPALQAVARPQMQYMELVCEQDSQVVPVAVMWVRPTSAPAWST